MDSIIKDDWKFTKAAIKNYSSELIDFVTKLLVKNPALRLGTVSDMEEIFAHPVFQKEIISANKVDLKADTYNLNQDFLTVKHRAKVSV